MIWGAEMQEEREKEVARLKEERHQARESKRKEEYVKQCRLDIEERRLKVRLTLPESLYHNFIASKTHIHDCAPSIKAVKAHGSSFSMWGSFSSQLSAL